MKLIAPDYYPLFECIAGRCRHSCCIGWEIDIDKETLQEYQSCPGEIGRKIRANIELTPDDEDAPAHFRLTEDERCPFLNKENLCDLILTLGEDSLCQICTDHPRFRNYWNDFTEIGLGMACEEAARIILSKETKMELIVLQDDETEPMKDNTDDETDSSETGTAPWDEGTVQDNDDAELQENDTELRDTTCEQQESGAESWNNGHELPENDTEQQDFVYEDDEAADEIEYLQLRSELMDILQDRSIPVDERIIRMMEYCELDTEGLVFTDGLLNEIACEQFAVYLLYRNYADVIYDGRLEERVRFVAESYMRVRNEWAVGGRTDVESLIDAARRFSDEVEYDTDTWA